MIEDGLDRMSRSFKFLGEEIKIYNLLRPDLATPNEVRLDLRMVKLRDYGKPGALVLAGAPIDTDAGDGPIKRMVRETPQAIEDLFKENRFAKGEFVGLGRVLELQDIICPTYLLAGAADDITTPEQVLSPRRRIALRRKRCPADMSGSSWAQRRSRNIGPTLRVGWRGNRRDGRRT